jgi:MinD-like ATPase involved in chromosome partitioning or flagellar assembly
MSMARPVTIAIVSGKGGVGKTMLAVAFAREMSRSNRTLLVDLDFFNRGLTGLLQRGKRVNTICRPDFLALPQDPEAETWEILEVASNLFHVSYPDLTEEDMRKFESSDVYDLKRSLEAFILAAAASCNCNCVVMDCHGGPDNSSFAACLFADYSLLVSEPDRITFYGTLNFIRQLRRTTQGKPLDIRLVFNKVIPAFSFFFLTNFYRKHLREEFQGRSLLAIFPLEVYLTKEFEKTPFLTEAYPTSLLARKTQVLLCDLLGSTHKSLLPPAVRSLPAWIREYRKFILGKQFVLFDLNFLMILIVAGFVVAVILSIPMPEHLPWLQQWMGNLRNDVTVGGDLMAAWFPVTLLIAWSRALELKFTYACRIRRRFLSVGVYAAALVLWFIPILAFVAFRTEKGRVFLWISYYLYAIFVIVALNQIFRVYRDFRYDRHPFENLLRLIFIPYLVVLPPVLSHFV